MAKPKGFTILELLVVVTLLGILLGLAAVAMSQAMAAAQKAICASNLRQIGFALRFYLDHNDGWFFRVVTREPKGNLWYFGYEADESRTRGEGSRILDRTRAKLYPYLQAPETVETCPSLPFGHPYKPKFRGKDWAYGINYQLSSHNSSVNIRSIRDENLCQTVLFADAAQVCTWLPPASNQRPMAEAHYYIRPRSRQVQFRHAGKANVLFADGHVEAVGPVEGSFDSRLPNAKIGYFNPKEFRFTPRGGR